VRKPTSVISTKNLTVGNTVKAVALDFGFAAGDLANPNVVRATITARLAGVMFTMDGTDPSATLGHIIPVNTNYVVEGTPNNITRLKFLREAGVDASVTVSLEA
jgi:hypothetical protein